METRSSHQELDCSGTHDGFHTSFGRGDPCTQCKKSRNVEDNLSLCNVTRPTCRPSQNLLTGTLRVLRVNSVPHLFLSLGAGVTPAAGSVKPAEGFTFNKVPIDAAAMTESTLSVFASIPPPLYRRRGFPRWQLRPNRLPNRRTRCTSSPRRANGSSRSP